MPELGRRRELPPRARRTSFLGEPTAPAHRDERSRALVERLRDLQRRHDELERRGEDTATTGAELLSVKHEVRQGGQLRAGEALAKGRYELIEPLGEGGFGRDWKAWDIKLRRLVAIKVLHSHHGGEGRRKDRFFRGAREMAKLDHPGIVRVLEVELEEDGFWYFVMEYLPGGDLEKAALAGRLDAPQAIGAVLAVAEALQFAHGRGVVHRDVKPANVLLDEAGAAKLTDFDLVHALETTAGTRYGTHMGTPVFAAPEAMDQAESAREPADIYSLGMTPCFALYGKKLPRAAIYDAAGSGARSRAQSRRGADPFRRRLGAGLCAGRGVHAGLRLDHRCREADSHGWLALVLDREVPGDPRAVRPLSGANPKVRKPAYWDDKLFNGPRHPVVGVSWQKAEAYCRWADLALPSEAQWEAAARGTDRRNFPWGNEAPTPSHANFGGSKGVTQPVSANPAGAGPFGKLDQAGNVWEWCADGWDAGAHRGREGRLDPHTPAGTGKEAGVALRGGVWFFQASRLAAAYRFGDWAGYRNPSLGFRGVLACSSEHAEPSPPGPLSQPTPQTFPRPAQPPGPREPPARAVGPRTPRNGLRMDAASPWFRRSSSVPRPVT